MQTRKRGSDGYSVSYSGLVNMGSRCPTLYFSTGNDFCWWLVSVLLSAEVWEVMTSEDVTEKKCNTCKWFTNSRELIIPDANHTKLGTCSAPIPKSARVVHDCKGYGCCGGGEVEGGNYVYDDETGCRAHLEAGK